MDLVESKRITERNLQKEKFKLQNAIRNNRGQDEIINIQTKVDYYDFILKYLGRS